MRLLLVEGDRVIGRGVPETRRDEAYVLDWVRDGVVAVPRIDSGLHDLAILGRGLPKKDGRAVLREIRGIKTTLRIELLSCQTPPMSETDMWVHLLAYN